MAGGLISATVDLTDPERGLSNLRSAGLNLRPAFAAMRKPFRDDQRDHAKAKAGPDGKWPARKRLSGNKGKRLLGRLTTAIGVKVEARAIYIVSKIPWSLAHQEGAIVGRGAKLPARPFLWVSDRMTDTAADIVEKHLEEAF